MKRFHRIFNITPPLTADKVVIIHRYMDAVLLLHKPEGITSFDAVSRCRRALQERKAGHTGTLDPNASGLMILLFGRYTKFLPYCVKDHKAYHATFRFGQMTDTGDIWGNPVAEKTPSAHTLAEVQAAADTFLGDGVQIPPMYSAIKINGQKLYELARKGKTVERTPRPVHIDRMEISLVDGIWHLDAVVSSGTYIRTLITDLGEKLGEYAVMSSLVRTGIESIPLSEACTIDELKEHPAFVTPERVLDPSFPVIEPENPEFIIHGRTVKLARTEQVVIFQQNGQILAAYERRGDGLYHCQRGLL